MLFKTLNLGISKGERNSIVKEAAKSDCGKTCQDISHKKRCLNANCSWNKKASPKCYSEDSHALSGMINEAAAKEQPYTGQGAASALPMMPMLVWWFLL